MKESIKQFTEEYFNNEQFIVTPLPMDASLREYYNIKTANKSYILMDCPPSYTSVEPFIAIDAFLRKSGFSAPQIYKKDITNGLLLLEHFGSTDIKKYISTSNPSGINDIYKLMIDLLVDLQKVQNLPKLKEHNNKLLQSELSLFTDHYIPYKYKKTLSNSEREEFNNLWSDILNRQVPIDTSIVLRDYHVENIMYLRDKTGINKLGLLDFQDALIGSPIYDLVSLLEDARINVDNNFANKMIEYYCTKKQFDIAEIKVNYSILGAQRNSRILGLFVKKFTAEKDSRYLDYLPRVEEYLSNDLSHDTMKPLKEWIDNLKVDFL